MGPRKDQVEKLAWQWAETTSPSDITTQHIRTAYILSPPHNRKTACKKNCRHQPLCLTGLGEQRWLQPASSSNITAVTAGSSAANSCEQQLQLPELRSAGVPAGLTNLGATCYVNSLLQLWFHNHAFRSAILQWSPYDDPTERDNPSLLTDCYQPLTPVGQLQLIFGLMLAAKLRTVETAPLVSSLRLDASYQQDAQEFSKLLSSLLEKSLQHQTSPRLRCLVQTLMRGQYEYVTRCSQCLVESVSAAPFYELDLQIQGNKQLLDCIAGFLSGEKLVGNNQYYCQFCNEKRDATRSIRLCSLPPVLNFQLMRFVFDRESGLKKKLSSQLQFPELLDMTQFGSFPADRCSVYRLQAVLLHKGRSAYSGHYTAQICNSETGFWFRFNDEEVEKIKSLKLPVDEDFTAGKKPVGRPPRCPKGFHSSGDAYMLVYMATSELLANQRSHDVTAGQSQLSTHLVDQSQLPEHLLSTIERINGDVQSRLNSIERQKDAAADVYQSREREVRELYPQLTSVDPSSSAAAAANGGSFCLLPTSWLSAWLQGDAPGPINTSDLLCPHGKLALQHASRVKCVQPGAAEMLSALYGGTTLDESALCRQCVLARCRVIRTKSLLEHHVKLISQILRQTSDANTAGDTGRQYWVGKRTLRNWRQMALASVPSDSVTTAATAENGCSRSPEELDDVRESGPSLEASHRVDGAEEAATATARLSPAPSVSSGVDISDSKTNISDSGKSRQCAVESLKPPRSVCGITALNNGVQRSSGEPGHGGRKSGGPVCENSDVKATEYIVSEAVASGASGDGVAVTKVEPVAGGVGSSAFSNSAAMNGERRSPVDSGGSEEKHATEEESSEEEEEVFNGDIICPHGCLCADESLRRLVPESVWGIFQQHFPGSAKFDQDTPACSECKRAMCEDEQMRQLYREMASEQRSSLSDLYLNRSRPQVAAPSAGATTGVTYNCVSEASTHRWRRYIRDPHKRCPTFLESGDLLCTHGRLLYNPNSAQDSSCLVLLHDWEWEVVRRSGHDGVQVTVTSSRSPCDDLVTQQQLSQSSRLITSPVACEECIEKRRAEEHQQQLQYERGRIFIRKVASIETELHATAAKRARLELDPAGADVLVRRSRRCRRSCVEKSVNVHSNDTLLTLKVQIMKLFKVATYDQHLVYDGIQLLDNQSTLSQLGVPTGSTILLQADEASEDADLTISEDMCASVCPELGFSGTGLADS